MIPKLFDAISKSDIESLIQNQVREGRTIEYRQIIPGNSDDDKREFLADISSFANAGGGDLLYGITATEGVPQEASGLEGNLDAELLRFENLIRDSLDPRIHGLRMKPIAGFAKGSVLLVRVPKSWAAPHMVTYRNLSRFFTRNSSGKHQMDVTEIRGTFSISEALPERIKRFRDERLGRIIANETPIRLTTGPQMIFHILPVASFMLNSNFDVIYLKERLKYGLCPIASNGWNTRVNLDGLVFHTGNGLVECRAYTQIFRSGQIEAVATDLTVANDKDKLLHSWEHEIAHAVGSYLISLKDLEVVPPFFFFLSFTGVAGFRIYVDRSFYRMSGAAIDRDTLFLPEVMIADYPLTSDVDETAKILRPAFDAFWNACGYERSFNFDDKGNWKPRR